MQGDNNGLPWANRFWLNATYSGTPTAAQVLALSNAVSAAWRSAFLSLLTVSVHLTSQRTVLYVDANTEIGVDGADTGSGGEAGSALPPQIALLINWAIAGTYRGGHPRTYLPPCTNVDVDGTGTLTGSKHTALTTAAGNFLSAVNALTPSGFTAVQLGTIRFFRHNAALAPPVFEPFLAGSGHPKVATQRRRVRT